MEDAPLGDALEAAQISTTVRATQPTQASRAVATGAIIGIEGRIIASVNDRRSAVAECGVCGYRRACNWCRRRRDAPSYEEETVDAAAPLPRALAAPVMVELGQDALDARRLPSLRTLARRAMARRFVREHQEGLVRVWGAWPGGFGPGLDDAMIPILRRHWPIWSSREVRLVMNEFLPQVRMVMSSFRPDGFGGGELQVHAYGIEKIKSYAAERGVGMNEPERRQTTGGRVGVRVRQWFAEVQAATLSACVYELVDQMYEFTCVWWEAQLGLFNWREPGGAYVHVRARGNWLMQIYNDGARHVVVTPSDGYAQVLYPGAFGAPHAWEAAMRPFGMPSLLGHLNLDEKRVVFGAVYVSLRDSELVRLSTLADREAGDWSIRRRLVPTYTRHMVQALCEIVRRRRVYGINTRHPTVLGERWEESTMFVGLLESWPARRVLVKLHEGPHLQEYEYGYAESVVEMDESGHPCAGGGYRMAQVAPPTWMEGPRDWPPYLYIGYRRPGGGRA